QAGDYKAALDGWLSLAADSAPDAPWMPALRAQLEHVASLMHVKLPDPLPSSTSMAEAPPPAAAPSPGPSTADIQAAQKLTGDERAQMIRSMVQRLADRLQKQPDDFDGWMRLARAYQVLGEADKAQDALSHAQKLRPGDPALKQALAAPPPAAGPVLPAGPAAPSAPGPTAADMQAAAQMSPDQRNQMIRSMVQRLADRLKKQPDDFDGWTRLARAYQVLGEADKAQDALSHARKLRPDDPALKAVPATPPADAAAAPPGIAPGPTVAQMQAAQAMPPDQRSAMIGAMVQQLADRLQRQPDDFAGWLKLGRAYQVLGRHQEASAAFDKAAALRPNDPSALLARATAMVEESGDDKPMPPQAESLFRQVLAMDPDSVDALWYVGMAELQAGRPAVAAAHWRRLLGKLDPKSPDYAEVEKALTGVEKAAAAAKARQP
ncbi:MAG TPA: tetratricopeptide repeat protein, partial [Candidatus Sulfotelmatobacter sp.]|nr:tetratricopeptide repeat protein [Candidatus Sulfotelmatobacter sp.]